MADERERVLVAHAPFLVEGGVLAFVPARVLAYEWRAERQIVSFCVKTSASFAEGLAEGSPARVPALWCEPPAWDLRCDLVPVRRACDVHVVGPAEIPPRPSGYGQGVRPAQVALGEKMKLSFFVDAQRPGRIPLEPQSVLDAGGVAGLEIGPKPVAHPGLILGDGFDFSTCQSAPEERRVGFDEVVDEITLVGLLPQDDPVTIDLPSIVPRLLLDPASENEEPQEIPLVLDGLTIDLARRAIDMTWRGAAEISIREIDRMILGFGPDVRGSLEERWYHPLRELPRGMFFWAWTLDDARDEKEPPPLEEGRLEMAQLEAWEFPVGPTPQLEMEIYARVTTELLEAREPREITLAKYDLDERRFAIEERAWADVFAQVPEGEESLLAEFGTMVAQFQDELARPHEANRTVKDYAQLVARMERGDAAKVLAEAKVTQPEFMRLERRMREAALADAAVSAELERELEEARAALPEAEDRLPPEVEEAMR